MTKYDVIFESLEEKVASGALTFEEACEINDLAFEKYTDVGVATEAEAILDAIEAEVIAEASLDCSDFGAKSVLYDIVNESLQEAYEIGDLTLEEARELNDYAFNTLME